MSARPLDQVAFYSRAVARLVVEYRQSGRSLRRAAASALRIASTGGLTGLAASIREVSARNAGTTGYAAWIARHDTLTPADLASLRARVARLQQRPLISVLMPVYETPESFLRAAIESVRAQVYENWELCIADDCSTRPHVAGVLHDYASRDPRIKLAFRAQNGHIAHASNSALELVAGEWVALLDHDDILRPHALAEVALEIGRHPDAELIYSDEDKLAADGSRFDPYFKPDFSRELFRSQNYLNHLTVHRTDNIRAVGGWRPGFEGSQDYDLNLRIFERIDLSRIGTSPRSSTTGVPCRGRPRSPAPRRAMPTRPAFGPSGSMWTARGCGRR